MNKQYKLYGTLVSNGIKYTLCTIPHDGELTDFKFNYLNTLMDSAVRTGNWTNLIWGITE